jgi:hypothetical protein
MNTTPTSKSELDARDAEIEALRARVAQLETELADQAAAANAQIAADQRRMYWLDRLEIDLNLLLARTWLAFLVSAPLKVRRGLRRELAAVRRRFGR